MLIGEVFLFFTDLPVHFFMPLLVYICVYIYLYLLDMTVQCDVISIISEVPDPNFTRLSLCHMSLHPGTILGRDYHYGTCALGLLLMSWVWIQLLLCCCLVVGGTLIQKSNVSYLISFQLLLPTVPECFITLPHLSMYCQYNLCLTNLLGCIGQSVASSLRGAGIFPLYSGLVRHIQSAVCNFGLPIRELRSYWCKPSKQPQTWLSDRSIVWGEAETAGIG